MLVLTKATMSPSPETDELPAADSAQQAHSEQSDSIAAPPGSATVPVAVMIPYDAAACLKTPHSTPVAVDHSASEDSESDSGDSSPLEFGSRSQSRVAHDSAEQDAHAEHQHLPPAKQQRRAGSNSPHQAAKIDEAASPPKAASPLHPSNGTMADTRNKAMNESEAVTKRTAAPNTNANGMASKRQTPVAGRRRLRKGVSPSSPRELPSSRVTRSASQPPSKVWYFDACDAGAGHHYTMCQPAKLDVSTLACMQN